jgi:hypothetical protein
MADFYVTTASNHPKGAGYWLVKASTVIKAREAAFNTLGDSWCFLYTSLDDVHELDRKCHGTIFGE